MIGIFLTHGDNPDWFTFLVLEEEEKGTGIDHKKSSTLGNRDIHRYPHASKRSVTTIKGIANRPPRPPPSSSNSQPPPAADSSLGDSFDITVICATERGGITYRSARSTARPEAAGVAGDPRGIPRIRGLGKNDQDVQRRDNHRPWQLRTAEWHASPPSFRLRDGVAGRGRLRSELC